MKPTRVIQSTYFAMLTLQTIGSVDAKHKLPAPKQYVALSVLWGILFLVADTGAGRVAARLSMLVLLTATVLGPFGKRLVQFLDTVANRFAIQPNSGAPGAGPAQPAAPSPSVEQPRFA